MSLRHRISSPLEAGPSILDAHRLPPHLDAALEYTASRLARKGLHVTLLVVRREYQLPVASPAEARDHLTLATPPASPPAAPSAAGPFRFASTIRSLVRAGTHPVLPSLDRAASWDLQRSRTVSPTFSLSSLSSIDSAASTPRWQFEPLSPFDSSYVPSTPATPATPATTATTASSVVTDSGACQAPNAFGIRLVHAAPLGLRQERAVRQVIERAERKFRTGTDWLPPARDRAAYGLPAELVQRSLAQNEVLFAAGGLTLLALDHLYTFKSALAAYSACGDPLAAAAKGDDARLRLEDAVDELRRCVLANSRRPLRRGALLRAYDGALRFGDDALADVTRMYARAYGGDGGVVGDALTMSPVPTMPAPRERPVDKPLPQIPSPVAEEEPEVEVEEVEDRSQDAATPPARPVVDEVREGSGDGFAIDAGVVVATAAATPVVVTPRRSPVVVTPRHSPVVVTPRRSPKTAPPLLRLQTTFEAPAPPADEKWEMAIRLDGDDGKADEEDEEDEDLTARPTGPVGGMPRWSRAAAFSIDEMLGDDLGPQVLGPATPHGFDDISPITRGEWGFLVGAQMGRTVAVTTC